MVNIDEKKIKEVVKEHYGGLGSGGEVPDRPGGHGARDGIVQRGGGSNIAERGCAGVGGVWEPYGPGNSEGRGDGCGFRERGRDRLLFGGTAGWGWGAGNRDRYDA